MRIVQKEVNKLNGELNLKPWVKVYSGRIGTGCVSITSSGGLSLALDLADHFPDEYVIFYYDEDNCAIGVAPANEDSRDSYKLQVGKRKQAKSINAKKILSVLNPIPKHYKGEWDPVQGMVVIQMERAEG